MEGVVVEEVEWEVQEEELADQAVTCTALRESADWTIAPHKWEAEAGKRLDIVRLM